MVKMTPEEIVEVYQKTRGLTVFDEDFGQAIADAAQVKLMQVLNEDCPHGYSLRLACPYCCRDIKQELGMVE